MLKTEICSEKTFVYTENKMVFHIVSQKQQENII